MHAGIAEALDDGFDLGFVGGLRAGNAVDGDDGEGEAGEAEIAVVVAEGGTNGFEQAETVEGVQPADGEDAAVGVGDVMDFLGGGDERLGGSGQLGVLRE